MVDLVLQGLRRIKKHGIKKIVFNTIFFLILTTVHSQLRDVLSKSLLTTSRNINNK